MEHAVLQCGEFSYHSRLNVNGRELKMGRDEAMFACSPPHNVGYSDFSL